MAISGSKQHSGAPANTSKPDSSLWSVLWRITQNGSKQKFNVLSIRTRQALAKTYDHRKLLLQYATDADDLDIVGIQMNNNKLIMGL